MTPFLPGPDVINNRPLDPWDHEVGALTNYLLLHTNKPDHKVLHNIPDLGLPVKDHRPVTSIHVEESRVDYSSTDCETLIIRSRSDLKICFLATFLLAIIELVVSNQLTTPSWPSLLKICAAIMLSKSENLGEMQKIDKV